MYIKRSFISIKEKVIIKYLIYIMPKKDCGDVQEWCETEFSTYCAETKTGQKIGTCQKKTWW